MSLINKPISSSCNLGILLGFAVCIFPAFHDGYPIPAVFLELIALASNPMLGIAIVLAQILLIVAIFRGSAMRKNTFTIVSIALLILCWIYMAMDVARHQFDLTLTIISSVPFACCIIWYFARLLLLKA